MLGILVSCTRDITSVTPQGGLYIHVDVEAILLRGSTRKIALRSSSLLKLVDHNTLILLASRMILHDRIGLITLQQHLQRTTV